MAKQSFIYDMKELLKNTKEIFNIILYTLATKYKIYYFIFPLYFMTFVPKDTNSPYISYSTSWKSWKNCFKW